MSNEPRPRHSLPLFWLCLATGFLLVTAWWSIGVYRAHAARQRLQDTVAQFQRDGQGAFIADLLPSLPPVNEARQERAWRWMNDWNRLSYPSLSDQSLNEWIDGLRPDVPDWRKLAKEHQNLLDEWDAIRRDGPVWLDVRGWLAQDIATTKTFTGPSARIGQLHGIRYALNAMRAHTLLGEKPQYLTQLDEVVSACDGGLLIDAMIHVAGLRIRDETYLGLARMGRLPPADYTRWLADVPDPLRLVGDSFRYERILFNGWLLQLMQEKSEREIRQMIWEDGSSLGATPPWQHQATKLAGDLLYPLIRPALYPLSDDLRFGMEELHNAELRLRGAQIPPLPIPSGAILSLISLPNLLESGMTAIQARLMAERYRLAARIITVARTHGLPVDEPELLQRLDPACLTAPYGLHHVYQRIDDNRFRLSTIVTGTVPMWFEATRIGKPKTVSKTPLTNRRSVFDSWSCEIEIRTPPSAPSTTTP